MTEKKYNPQAIEKKWQAYWDREQTFVTEVDLSKPKYYVLDMFPYPSGSGLHVGHVTGYAGTDVIARHKRQRGFNVLHPMGWDSFGLPAEQHAIRTGVHPSILTEENINTYRRQLKSLGLSYDWSREIATSDATYYKWTQWIFTKLYEKDLAYEAEISVNFCPSLGTVLANEEVENGKSIEGGFPVERRPLRQWILKITAYAERLLEDLDLLDWPDHLKRLQRNWIGKSEGMNIHFQVEGHAQKITCYTTRPDTIASVTYVVLAPEHFLVDELTTSEQREVVEKYKKMAAGKSDLERTDLAKNKSGAFTGSYVLHPTTGEKLPIWIADYVLFSYGSGAVMAVPIDDERDREFAAIYNLPAKELTGETAESAMAHLEKMGKGERTVNYKLRDWLFSRQRYWGEPFPILHFEDGSKRILGLDELPLMPPLMEDYKPSPTGESPLAKVKSWVEIIDSKTGKRAYRETNTMPQWAGSCWYYLRFCDPHNEVAAWDKAKENYWMPVDLYVGGVEHAVLHLLYARFWHKVLYDLGLVSTPEPFKALRNQGLVTSRSYKLDGGGYVPEKGVVEENGHFIEQATGKKVTPMVEKMSKSKLNGVSPDEIIEEFGADALRLYELFMTPFDKEKLWQSDAVSGCKRFLTRVYDMVVSDKVSEEGSAQADKLIHRLIKQVGDDLEVLSFNTAIAKMMECLNNFSQLSSYPRESLKAFVQMVYPFAPHFGEECWELLGEKGSITNAPFPSYEERFLIDDEVTVVFQVMGKLRGQKSFKKGVTKEVALEAALQEATVMKFLTGEVKNVIYIPDKLLNIVIK